VDNGTLTFGEPSSDGHVLVFRRGRLVPKGGVQWKPLQDYVARDSKLGGQRLWFATIAPLRNAAGLYDPSKGYLVTFGSFEDAVQRDTLEEAKLHVLAIHALTG
jgi:hypothetical protein